MNNASTTGRFIGYEYLEISMESVKFSMFLDCYTNFGWHLDENVASRDYVGTTTATLKRDRKILNKMELTRLQRNFEACMRDIEKLERSKTLYATVIAIATGLLGTAFVAGSVFAVTASPPVVWLCVLLGILGFAGWALPVVLFKRLAQQKAAALRPLIEQKYDEIYEVCEKGSSLLL